MRFNWFKRWETWAALLALIAIIWGYRRSRIRQDTPKPPGWFRRWENWVAILLTIIVLILHLLIITQVRSQILDEAHYVPEAAAILAREELDNQEHPPFGKLLIAGSIWAFGDYAKGSDVGGNSWYNVFSVGSDGQILHYNGHDWHRMSSGTSKDLFRVWVSATSEAFAVGAAGTMLRYDGNAWETLPTITAHDLYDVWGSSADKVFAVGSDGIILKYDANGWSPSPSTIATDLNGIWGNSSTDAFAVGAAGAILHYNGSLWQPMTSGTAEDLFAVWGSAPDDVFAVGAAGTILHYDGSAWTTSRNYNHNDLFDIWGSSSQDVFAVGDNGTVRHYDGTSWTSKSHDSPLPLKGIWGSSDTNIYTIETSGTIWHYNGGNGWGPQRNDPASWRIPSILFGTIAVMLFYLVCQKLTLHRYVPLIATFIFAFENMNFIQSSVAMLGVFALTPMLAAFLLFLHSRYFASGITLALGALGKLPGALGGGVTLAFWLLAKRRPKRDFPKVLLVAPVAFIVLMPLLDWLATGQLLYPWDRLEFMRDQMSSLKFSNVDDSRLHQPWEWIILPLRMAFWYHPDYDSAVSWTVWGLLIPAMIYALYEVIRNRDRLCLFALLWIICTYFVWYPIYWITDRVMFIFYFYPTVGAFCLILGLGIARLVTLAQRRRRKWVKWAILIFPAGWMIAHLVIFFWMGPVWEQIT